MTYRDLMDVEVSERRPLPAWALRSIEYALFFWVSIYMTPAYIVTPDILVMAVVLLSAGIILRIRCGANNQWLFVALGLVLGLGYLSKTSMFPTGIVFLGAALLAVRNLRQTVPPFLSAVFVFVLVSAPFAFALSKSKGRLTWGDSGTINYAEHVNRATAYIHWQGQPPGTGTPKHPTRRVLDSPLVYEYAQPVGGSYPPWTDPSYWYDGIRPHFNLKQQLKTLISSLVSYYGLFSQLAGLCTGLVVLLLWSADLYGFTKNFFQEIFLWGPAAVALGMYSLVWVLPRYVSGFVMLVFAALLLALRVPLSAPGRAFVRAVTIAIVITLGLQIIEPVGESILELRAGRTAPSWEVAQGLWSNGVNPGSKVAFIGDAAWDHYWAHLAQISITAEVAGAGVSEFWVADPQIKAKITSIFLQTGAKAVVAKEVPPSLLRDGWVLIPHTNYYVLPLKN